MAIEKNKLNKYMTDFRVLTRITKKVADLSLCQSCVCVIFSHIICARSILYTQQLEYFKFNVKIDHPTPLYNIKRFV